MLFGYFDHLTIRNYRDIILVQNQTRRINNMFISKKKWQEMHKEFYQRFEELEKSRDIQARRIRELEIIVKALRDAHNCINYIITTDNSIPNAFTHLDVSVNTVACGDVTIEELAQFVIDRKPIERTVETKSILNPPPCGDSCTAKIDDMIGEISYESKS
jgi:hypothetical protein